MAESILVVDLGSYATKVALVEGDQYKIGDPWPAGTRIENVMMGRRVDRLVLTTPAGDDQRRQALIKLAAEAGYPDAELVPEAVAAAREAPGQGLVLVCDLGATWKVT